MEPKRRPEFPHPAERPIRAATHEAPSITSRLLLRPAFGGQRSCASSASMAGGPGYEGHRADADGDGDSDTMVFMKIATIMLTLRNTVSRAVDFQFIIGFRSTLAA